MFMTSHLDQPHHAMAPAAYHGGNALSGLGEDAAPAAPDPTSTTAPTSPAPISLISPQYTNILIVGGIAIVLFLYLRSKNN